MKKLLILLISLLLVLFVLCSCNKENVTEGTSSPSDAQASETTESGTQKEYNDGKLRIFADGKYYCNIVRPESASDNELDIYVSIRNIFKEFTGVMPPLATDFKAHNEQ